jgi:hypothetical protein
MNPLLLPRLQQQQQLGRLVRRATKIWSLSWTTVSKTTMFLSSPKAKQYQYQCRPAAPLQLL